MKTFEALHWEASKLLLVWQREVFSLSIRPHLDRLHVTFNGKELPCLNPLEAGGLAPDERTWLVYDLAEALPKQGKNEVTVSVKRAERLAEEMPLVLSDLELAICHKYPHGAFREPPGYLPRT